MKRVEMGCGRQCSASVTSTSALMLVQEGKLSLDEKLGAILPDVPESWRGATIDQILHHISGIPDYEEIATYDFYNQARQPKEIIEELYLRTLNRFPTTTETTRLQEFFGEDKDNAVVLNDLFWSLLNAKEFVFNH